MVKESKETPFPEMPLPSFEPTKIDFFVHTNNIEITSKESLHQSYFDLLVFYDSDPPIPFSTHRLRSLSSD